MLAKSVNRHLLSRLLSLETPVLCTRDLITVDAACLLSAGSRLQAAHGPALLNASLVHPLETCLAAPGGVHAARLHALGQDWLDQCVPLQRILRSAGVPAEQALRVLSQLDISPATALLLTCLGEHLAHCVLVSMLSYGLARKLRLTEEEQQQATLAGLLHDLGELYLDPALQLTGRRLTALEWAQHVSHPRLGQQLVDALESYPRAVGRAIAEHHERFDGTGYPRQLAGHALSPIGQALGVADVVAGVVRTGAPLERAELALKLIPGEHAQDLVASIAPVLSATARPAPALEPDLEGEVERLYWRIRGALDFGESLLETSLERSPRAAELLGHTLERIEKLQRAFISTGLDLYLQRHVTLPLGLEGGLLFEKSVSMRELQWRLRDLARDLALQAPAAREQALFAPLIRLLEDESVAPAGGSEEPPYVSHLHKKEMATEAAIRPFPVEQVGS